MADRIAPFRFLTTLDLKVKSDHFCWSKAKAVIKCLLSYADPDLSYSQINVLRPGQRDKVFGEAFEGMCQSIMLVSRMDESKW